MSVFDKKRSGPGSVFDKQQPASGPGSVFDKKPNSSPGSVFDKKPADNPGPTSVFTKNQLPESAKKSGVKFGAPVWHGPVPLKPNTGKTKQSKTLLMMQQMCDDGQDLTAVGTTFDQDKGLDRPEYQKWDDKPTIDQQFYGKSGEGLENSRFDPFREDYGPTSEGDSGKYNPY